jgi:N-hydroxyarylamine O-acetyltransferase
MRFHEDALEVAGQREWTVERVDLPAYLRRVGLDATSPPRPDLAFLRRLQRAHQHSIPFENADIVLGRGVELDLDAIQHKLITQHRGGYCHEHNLLFAAVLERLGYEVTRLTGRVRVGGSAALRPRTHMTLRVRADDLDLLADVGFGGTSPIEPLALHDGAQASQDGWTYRLTRAPPDGWVLRVREDGRWSDLYSFGPEPAHLVDYTVATHYTSTHPRSPFVRRLRVALAFSDYWLLLQGRHLSELRATGSASRGDLDDDAFNQALTDTFGLSMSPADLLALTRFTSS